MKIDDARLDELVQKALSRVRRKRKLIDALSGKVPEMSEDDIEKIADELVDIFIKVTTKKSS